MAPSDDKTKDEKKKVKETPKIHPFPEIEMFLANLHVLINKVQNISEKAHICIPTVMVSIPLKGVGLFFAQKHHIDIEYHQENGKSVPYMQLYVNGNNFDTTLAQIQEFEEDFQAFLIYKHIPEK